MKWSSKTEQHGRWIKNENKRDDGIQINETDKKAGPKYNIMNIGMGSGKAEQTVNVLSKVDNFIWIAPKPSFNI